MVMERSLGSRSVATTAVVVIGAVWLMSIPADGKVCGDCIKERMEVYCTACAPPLRCMAQCLWGGGAPTSTCTKRCDCGGAWPRLSTCKPCLSSCYSSCVASST